MTSHRTARLASESSAPLADSQVRPTRYPSAPDLSPECDVTQAQWRYYGADGRCTQCGLPSECHEY